MRKMILSGVAAVIVFASTLPSLAVASCDEAKSTALGTTQAPYGWRLAGKYRSYAAAYRKADQLEENGYETYVKMQGRYYWVYYR